MSLLLQQQQQQPFCGPLSVNNSVIGIGVVIRLESGENYMHTVQLMLLPPIICCFIKIQIWLNLSDASLPTLFWKRDR